MLKAIRHLLFLYLLTVLLYSCSDSEQKEYDNIENPVNPTKQFSYEFNGLEISDNYHWIEQLNNQEVKDWITNQSTLSDEYFARDAFEVFKNQASELPLVDNYFWAQKYSYYYYFAVESLSEVSSQWYLSQYNSISNRLISYETNLAQNESIEGLRISPDARYLASLIKLTNDKFQWRIYDTAIKSFLDKQLPILSIKTNLQWYAEDSFIYSSSKKVIATKIRSSSLFDATVFDYESLDEDPSTILDWQPPSARITNDHNYLLVATESNSKPGSKFWVSLLENDKENTTSIINNINANFEFLGNNESKFFFLTNLAASKNRIISIDLNQPSRRSWKEVIAQSKDLLINAKLLSNNWLLFYKENSRNRIIKTTLNGRNAKEISSDPFANYSLHPSSFPQNEKLRSKDLALTKRSTISPSLSVTLNQTKNQLIPIDVTKQNLNSVTTDIQSQVHFFRSDDGSRVPITLISKSKIKRNNPTLMLANDGDGSIYQHSYNPVVQRFIDHGGTVAVVHARGGSTYGTSWYHAATGKKRIKIVEDFIAAQNWLLDKHYTTTDKLAVYGTSLNSSSFSLFLNNPGSNVEVAILVDGEFDLIARAKVLSSSPVDNIWAKNFAYKETASSTEVLLALNPLSSIKPKSFPSTLIVSDSVQTDDLKYLAKLQNYQLTNKPILWLNPEQQDKNDKIVFFLKQQLKL